MSEMIDAIALRRFTMDHGSVEYAAGARVRLPAAQFHEFAQAQMVKRAPSTKPEPKLKAKTPS